MARAWNAYGRSPRGERLSGLARTGAREPDTDRVLSLTLHPRHALSTVPRQVSLTRGNLSLDRRCTRCKAAMSPRYMGFKSGLEGRDTHDPRRTPTHHRLVRPH